jgi:putative heme-binding domain-containing protein
MSPRFSSLPPLSAVFLIGVFTSTATPSPLVHLDVAAQPAMRQKQALPPLSANQAADIVIASGSVAGHLSFKSELTPHRPHFITNGTQAFLRFDGDDDFLSLSGPRRLSAAATVFVLAAPQGNKGAFAGLFSCAEAGKNDYTSGLNLDLGPQPTKELSVLNIESAGATGFRDLLNPPHNLAANLPFGGFHVFTVRSQIKPEGNALWLDGVPLATRDRLESNLGLDQMVIGARYYSNDPSQQPFVGSFFHGDIAEVMVFDSALTDDEVKAIEQALFAKVPELNALAQGRSGHMLQTLKDPPPVQMLVPGFSVCELPVKLTNRNNVRYRHDGKLVALGYDGTIHLLSDTDGDGLEDKAEVFWDQPTMRGPLGIELKKKGDPRGDGVFVPSKGKVSLVLDRDRDGKADEEIIVAKGWQEIVQNVDAVGIAIDPKDGSIYFGLGCTNFANAYLIDQKTGKAGYDPKSEHGTIQKVSPDFKKRETVCTGVRFTCALGFNREGDLFATDQEGATWLPNGNPLDELLHIQPGKHYGFPPRHPKHLPDVLDWPPVMEYGPQHQSTVGMCFNEGVNGGPVFGPEFWAGDALVCGEARGKLYRTKLVKTPHGYVGQNHLIACLGLLTVDCCVSPAGDLVIACHSGPPDWGTGPKGPGRMFKVKYKGKFVPQPVWAWAAAPDEFRVAFDKELKPEEWRGLVANVGKAAAHRSVASATPENSRGLQPTVAAGEDKASRERRRNSVESLAQRKNSGVADATHVLALSAPWIETHGYHPLSRTRQAVGIVTPDAGAPRSPIRIEAGRHVMPGDRYEVIRPGYQVVRDQMSEPRRDVKVLGLTLTSDRRTLILKVPRQTEPVGYAVTLPLPDSWQQKSAIPQRAEMDVLVTLNAVLPGFSAAGLVPPSAQFEVNTDDPFLPAIQPGATLDWEPLIAGATLTNDRNALDCLDHVVPLPISRTFLPWARRNMVIAAAEPREIFPGNWLAGRRVFFSNEAACSTCHQIRGEGIAVGPDLTNLAFRDRESVLRDILHPSATINPDHPASTVKLKDGNSLTGIVRRADEKEVSVALQAGAVPVLSRGDVAGIELLQTSFMPEGYADRLTKSQQDDLLSFLTTSPLEPAPIERTDPPAPAPRKQAEVTALIEKLKSTDPSQRKDAPEKPKPLRILLASGPKDHGPGEHDYPLWQKRWQKLLPLAEGVTVDTSWEFPDADHLNAADVTVFYSRNPGFNPRTALLLDEYQQRGGGLVYLHWAVNGDEHALILAERIGLAGGKFGVKYRHGEFDLVFTQPEHPVTRGLPTLHFTDETYWAMQGDPSRIRVLGTGVEEGEPRPQLWALERHKGRVIGCVPGHYTWTFDDPYYRLIVLRAICWTAKQDNVDRLADLATIGARISP